MTVLDGFYFVLPELILTLAACILFLGATFSVRRGVWGAFALIALLAAGLALFLTPLPRAGGEARSFQWLPEVWARLASWNFAEVAGVYATSPIILDRFALLVKAIALGGGIILVLASWNEVPDRQAAEYHACLLLIVAGLGLTATANDLVMMFLALELVSIPTYVLLYLPRHDRPAQEAALKYFMLSIFSSALLLFGFSYLYGLSGATTLPAVWKGLNAAGQGELPGIAVVALIMVVAGLGFRITAVPFHFYAPDVYQGTTAVVAGLLAFLPKVAGFAALARVLGFVTIGTTGLSLGAQVPMMFYILAIVTMSLGNLLGLLQENLKRLLAYSSVAQAGYMLIALAIAPGLRRDPDDLAPGLAGGLDGLLFYLVAYGAMTMGVFAIIAYLNTRDRPVENIDDLAGLSRSHPGIALLMGLFLFSLIGMPLTAGFMGKLQLFFGAVVVPPPTEHPLLYRMLALVAVVNSAVGAWYYLRVLAVMYLRTPIKPLAPPPNRPGLVAVWLCAAVTLVFGVYPAPLSRTARDASGMVAPRPIEQAAR